MQPLFDVNGSSQVPPRRPAEQSKSPVQPDSVASPRRPLEPPKSPVTSGITVPPRRPLKRRSIITAIIIILLITAAIAAYTFLWPKAGSIDTGKYQALFLSNGQVYFGKLSKGNDNTYVLRDIYYLQASTDSQNPQNAAKAGTDTKLIKLGSEVHGPEDQMVVMTDQVLFYENLKHDGNVVKSIQQYESNKH